MICWSPGERGTAKCSSYPSGSWAYFYSVGTGVQWVHGVRHGAKGILVESSDPGSDINRGRSNERGIGKAIPFPMVSSGRIR